MAQSRDRRRTVSTNLIATGVSHVASSFPPIAPPRGPPYRGPSVGISSVIAGGSCIEDALFPPLRSRRGRKLLVDLDPRTRDRTEPQGRARPIGGARTRAWARARRGGGRGVGKEGARREYGERARSVVRGLWSEVWGLGTGLWALGSGVWSEPWWMQRRWKGASTDPANNSEDNNNPVRHLRVIWR
ncbi:hypothetical protein KM043_014542 [Ampulex compressa]|nr:hypothetical protein KM043_014542 [Ampulex compressa]